MNEQALRAVAVLRQSDTRNGDNDDPTKSLGAQASRVESECDRQGWALTETYEEASTSGGKSLAKRRGLLAAVEMIEEGAADVLVVAYRDRLDRDLDVRREVARRVEAAGGVVYACDSGRITFGTAADKLAATVTGAMDENYRETIREKVADNKAARVAEGLPVGRAPKLGYRPSGKRGRLEMVEAEAEVVRQAWAMVADGRSVREVREMSEAAGFSLTYAQAATMLSRSAGECYLGRIVWGSLRNDEAHEPILDGRTFERRFAAHRPRNGKKSNDLLARLAVLTCDRCGARLVVGTGGGGVGDYRHPPNTDCVAEHGMLTIPREPVREAVVHATRRALLAVWGSSAEAVEQAEAEVERIEARLSKARRLALDSDDEQGFAATIRDLVAERDTARRAADDARAASGVRLNGSDTWDDLGQTTQREMIGTVVATVKVTRLREMPEGHDRRDYSERLAFVYRPGFARQAERVLDDVAEVVAGLDLDGGFATTRPAKPGSIGPAEVVAV